MFTMSIPYSNDVSLRRFLVRATPLFCFVSLFDPLGVSHVNSLPFFFIFIHDFGGGGVRI